MSEQKPINSNFSALSKSSDIMKGIDLSGKVAIITGGYSGIGLESAKQLLKAGAEIIIPVKPGSEKKAQAAFQFLFPPCGKMSDCKQTKPCAASSLFPFRPCWQRNKPLYKIPKMPLLDLSDSQSINCFASNFLSKYEKLDFLINNAGIMALPNLERDKRGIEMQFAVNYLGHFHLTLKLLPALKRAGAARVINTSSRAHRLCGVNFGDINFHKTIYNKWNSYAQSKSANVLFTVELDRQMKDSGIRSFAVHPGLVPFTNLARRQDDSKTSQKSAAFLKKAFYFLSQNFPSAILKVKNLGKRGGDRLKTIEQGAAAILWCLTSPLLEGKGGIYCEDCNIAEIVIADGKSGNKISPSGVYPWAIDCGLAKKLWEIGLKAIEADKLVE